jgi:hypothetical protein
VVIIAVQPAGGQHVVFDQGMKRLKDRRTGADLVGQLRQAQIDAFPGVALALAVQGLMLTELSRTGSWPGDWDRQSHAA